MELYTTVIAERVGLRRAVLFVAAASLLTNVLLAGALLAHRPETRTVIIPPTLAQEREVWTFTEAGPSAAYLERFALSLLSYVATVTPETVDSSRIAVLKHTDASVYGDIESAFLIEGDRMKKDHSSTIFYPQKAVVDDKKLVVKVTGTQKLVVGNTVTSTRTKSWTMRFRYAAGRLFLLSVTDRES